MSRNKWMIWLLAILPALAGLLAFSTVFLPYEKLSSLLNILSPDGNYSTLRPDNAVVFRFLFAGFGLAAFLGAYLIGFHKWKMVKAFFRQLWEDTRRFFAAMRIAKEERFFLIALLFVVVMAVIRRLADINIPMQHDESYTVVNFADSFWHAITDYSLPNNHVFHTILVWLSKKWFGMAPWAVRLPAFIAGVLVIPAIYFLARRLYDHWTALMASLLAAFSPMLISYSVNSRGYSLVALLTLLIILLGSFVRREKNLFAWGLISLLSALGFFTVPTMLFSFVILFIWLFFENLVTGPGAYCSKREFVIYWLVAGAATAVLTVLFYTTILIYAGPQQLLGNRTIAPLAWGDFLAASRSQITETWSQWTFGVPWAVPVLLAAGILLSIVFHRRLSRDRIPWQLAAFVGIAAVLIIQRLNAPVRVWLFLQPLMLIWGAAGTIGLLRGIRLKFTRGVSLAAIVTGAAFLIGLLATVRIIPTFPERWAEKGDVETTILYLESQLQENDFIVVTIPDDAPVWYYSLLHGIDNSHFDKRIPFERALALVEPVEGQTLKAVLAVRGPDEDILDIEAASLLKTFGKVQIFEVPRK